MSPVTVELIDRPGCHLCDDVRSVLAAVLPEFPNAVLVEIDVDSDAQLREQFTNDVPVLRINGELHSRWRTTEPALREALITAEGTA
ncbi:MAG: hypothetical protein RL431_534 [Actinomycetota bacterium]|jgi:glutaredoxin